jgi:hypothetical protein
LFGGPRVALVDFGKDSRDVAHIGSKGTFKTIREVEIVFRIASV